MEANIESGVSEHVLNSWEEFGPFILRSHANSPAFIYRGQGDAKWKLWSTLDRLEARFPTKKNFVGTIPRDFQCPPTGRETHLEAFKEAVRGKRGPSPQDFTEQEWWALAQHHGLATPLLDWTYSPFVALFFAFEDGGFVEKKAHYEPERRAVYVVPFHLIGEAASPDVPAPIVFSPRREISHRLSSQAGVLMQMPAGTDLESSVRTKFANESSSTQPHARAILTRILIPSAGRVECLKYLNKMNINRMSLYGDLDGAARYINSLWELDWDTALGQLPSGTATQTG